MITTPSSNLGSTTSLVTIAVLEKLSYKRSRFTAHTLAKDGSTILYNSLTGRHCAIPAHHRHTLKQYLSLAGWTTELDSLGQYLFHKGYIVKASTDEVSAWDVRYGQGQYRADHLELMLLASEDCNFRCIYCSQQFKRDSMQLFVRQAVMRLLEERLQSLNSLDIQWFGGEPLVGLDAIQELAPQIQAFARKRGTVLSCGMTTNGFLLTPDISRQLLEWDIRSYQITLDGTAEEHDSHRPLKDGGNTFSTILANLLAMQQIDQPFTVALRVNADKTNSAKLTPLFETLAASFGKDERFQLRFKAIGKWGGDKDDSLEVFCSKTEERNTLVQLKQQARGMGMNVESPTLQLQPNQVCYASRPYAMIVGADGKLMKCSVVLDTMPANVVGSIHQDGSMHINDEMFLQWVKPFYKSDTTCQNCFFLPSCQGAQCTLPRFLGERPCPTVKTEIQATLQTLYKYEVES